MDDPCTYNSSLEKDQLLLVVKETAILGVSPSNPFPYWVLLLVSGGVSSPASGSRDTADLLLPSAQS